jgi:N-formylglutamate deformylase
MVQQSWPAAGPLGVEKVNWPRPDDPPFYAAFPGEGPLVASAIHDGHFVRHEVSALLALDDAVRLREEDPYTALLTAIAPNRLIGRRSRFEVDLNRPRDKAVYQLPEDAWGLNVWKSSPPAALVERSLAGYDAFYAHVHELLESLISLYGGFVVLDLHSYNHRRSGPGSAVADPVANPDINIGTGSVNRDRWGPLIDEFMEGLRSTKTGAGAALDVRENVKFLGGNFSTWINQTFPSNGVAIAVEFKKIFMDEWTGVCDFPLLQDLRRSLEVGAAAALRQLQVAL